MLNLTVDALIGAVFYIPDGSRQKNIPAGAWEY
jgi:hypothetical protein